MLVLVVNAGSSSLKAQLIQTDGKASLMKCLAEKVGTPQAFMNVSFAPDFEKVTVPVEGLSVPGCLRELLAAGTLFNQKILSRALLPVAGQVSGGFLIVGLLAAVWLAVRGMYVEYKKEEVSRLYGKRKR